MLWDSSLTLGIKAIDDQHKELLKKIDDFMDACTKQKGKEAVEETLGFLADYVIKHFTDEEGIHQSVQYPKALAHKQLHASFVKQLNELQQKFRSEGGNLNVILQTNKTAIDWVIKHIRGADKEFANYYTSRQ